jgi:hypothetical protein
METRVGAGPADPGPWSGLYQDPKRDFEGEDISYEI